VVVWVLDARTPAIADVGLDILVESVPPVPVGDKLLGAVSFGVDVRIGCVCVLDDPCLKVVRNNDLLDFGTQFRRPPESTVADEGIVLKVEAENPLVPNSDSTDSFVVLGR
jgi:hypothetical protein